MGVHIQPSPMPYQASKEGGRSHPRPRSADRHPRFAGRGATESVPATCGIGGVPIAGAISCPATPKVPWALVDRHRAHRFGSGPTPSARLNRAQDRPSRDWRRCPADATFQTRRSCSPSSKKESNDGTHETSPAQLWRRRMGPEPGPGLSRSQDRLVPDRVTRGRAQAHKVAQASRLEAGEEAGGRVRRRIRRSGAERQEERRARAAHAGNAF